MVNHNNQITVSPFVGDLIDSDPTQTRKTINLGLNIIVDSGDDRPDSPPSHPKELTGRTLRSSDSKPRRHRVEVAGVARTMSRPRDLHHSMTVGSTLDPWSVGFDKHSGGARI